MALSRGEILPGCLANPLQRLHLVLRYALALGVATAQIELSQGIILLGGFAEPLRCFRIILRGTEAEADALISAARRVSAGSV